MAKKPKLTAWERAQIVRLELKSFKQGAAGIETPDIDARQQRIRDRAAKRTNGK